MFCIKRLINKYITAQQNINQWQTVEQKQNRYIINWSHS